MNPLGNAVADERITVVGRPALEAFDADVPALAGPFDLAFIDALKQEYRAYVEALLPRLDPGALVVADNVLWSGAVADPANTDESTTALRALNDALAADDRVEAVMLPVADGLFLVRPRR